MPATNPAERVIYAQMGGIKRQYGDDDPRLADLRRELLIAKREAHLERLVEDDSLPFTDEDRAHFALLLPPVSDEEAA